MSPRATKGRSRSKLQRWTDLIAALLARNYLVTFDQLAREVPAYADALDPAHKDSVKRTFERDKDELKAFGVPIEVVTIEEGESTGYRLNPKLFYLPYLTLTQRSHRPHKPAGYRALPEIEFEPDEIGTLVHALKRLDALGDPMLREDADAALAKIGFDLPTLPDSPMDVTILADDRVTPATFDALTQALRRRKLVTFAYRSPASGVSAARRICPYGLFFIHAHWYLAGFDEDRDAARNFRVSRMSAVRVNKAQPQTPDFDIPADFRLQQHARSRSAWELGDDAPIMAEVQFTGFSGVARAAASRGEGVDGREDVRRFPVRRLDTFARWLLSLGGEALPVSPPEPVSAWRSLACETLKIYDRN